MVTRTNHPGPQQATPLTAGRPQQTAMQPNRPQSGTGWNTEEMTKGSKIGPCKPQALSAAAQKDTHGTVTIGGWHGRSGVPPDLRWEPRPPRTSGSDSTWEMGGL